MVDIRLMVKICLRVENNSECSKIFPITKKCGMVETIIMITSFRRTEILLMLFIRLMIENNSEWSKKFPIDEKCGMVVRLGMII